MKNCFERSNIQLFDLMLCNYFIMICGCVYLKEKDQKQQLYSTAAPSITAASEITTSHYDAHLPPHLMQHYKYQQQV